MAQTEEAQRFAARIRGLKDRAGFSFEELAKRTGVSGSSLHRYCSGTKFPSNYGIVGAFAKVCGASNAELKELRELWILAEAALSSTPAGGTAEDAETADPPPPPSPEPPSAPPAAAHVSWLRRVRRPVFVAVFVVSVAANAITAIDVLNSRHSHASTTPKSRPSAAGTTAQVRVFNIEGDCKTRKDRIPACSMGLARNPRLKYGVGNVVAHRVWHNDVLNADCVLYDGDLVKDETGDETTRWFRVRLNDVPGGVAWLPAVRTHDNPTLPTCYG